jgi:hypothetical protein
MEIQAERDETHIPTLETVEEKQKQHERSISKVHKSKKALAETKKLLKKPKQIVKERSEHWRFKSGEQVFDEVGLPFSFEAVDELKKDALLCLYRGLKTSGFPRAQHFSLKDTVCLLMMKDICNAVGIEVPDEGIKAGRRRSFSCARHGTQGLVLSSGCIHASVPRETRCPFH